MIPVIISYIIWFKEFLMEAKFVVETLMSYNQI